MGRYFNGLPPFLCIDTIVSDYEIAEKIHDFTMSPRTKNELERSE